jgi:hypothetical protein
MTGSGLTIVVATLLVGFARAEPQLLRSQGYQNQATVGPGEQLLLLGYDLRPTDRFEYRPRGARLAASNSPKILRINVALGDAAFARWPDDLREREPIEIWVSRDGRSSGGAKLVNERMPLWFTPTRVVRSQQASEAKILKIVGRNLAARAGEVIRIRFAEASSTRSFAVSVNDTPISQSEFELRVSLPAEIPAGRYAVSVSRRDGSWESLPEQWLWIEDARSSRDFLLGDVDPACQANDSQDDSRCLQQAVLYVAEHGGGTLRLPSGILRIGAPTGSLDWRTQGIVVPLGVNLIGASRGSQLRWTAATGREPFQPALTLLGRSRIEDISFEWYAPHEPAATDGAFIMLGRSLARALKNDTREHEPVANVELRNNRFVGARTAVADSGHAVRELIVEHNEFAAESTSLLLGGNRYIAAQRFAIEDSVIAKNVFLPGSFVDQAQGAGPIAAELGAARRLDFTANIADGSMATARQRGAASGWRAGFFWHLADSVEMLLISSNRISCAGGRLGDGEAIALDNNGNTLGFSGLTHVVAADRRQVVLNRSFSQKQNGVDIDTVNYYRGHWVRVADGPGVGQARRIEKISVSKMGMRLELDRDWDIVPVVGQSRLVVARQYWQVFVIGNTIDERSSLCGDPTPHRAKGGSIALWAHASDIAIVGNTLLESDGIVYHQTFSIRNDRCRECPDATSLLSSIEILDNRILGERHWPNNCSDSGIRAAFGSSPNLPEAPPTLGLAIRIARNHIERADGAQGGAISFPLTWHSGPKQANDQAWPMLQYTIIEGNRLRNIDGEDSHGRCGLAGSARIGIHLPNRHVVDTAVVNNSCTNVSVGIRDHSTRTRLHCDRGGLACGCGSSKEKMQNRNHRQ